MEAVKRTWRFRHGWKSYRELAIDKNRTSEWEWEKFFVTLPLSLGYIASA